MSSKKTINNVASELSKVVTNTFKEHKINFAEGLGILELIKIDITQAYKDAQDG